MAKNYGLLSEIKNRVDLDKIANRERSAAKNILNLSKINGDTDPTMAEQALAEINANSGALTQQLSVDDLKKFDNAYKRMSKSYKTHRIRGGIRPRTIINRSRSEDIKRCETEIPMAKPVSVDKYGVVQFWVSASHKYGAMNHRVAVQFLNFGASIDAKMTDKQRLDNVINAPVKFDCDCGRHRFWYRYIATAGGFNLGRGESGFPKIRNPELTGLGCKHVLRVMLFITKSPMFRAFMLSALNRYRDNPNARKHTLTDKQVDKLSEKISKESWQDKKVRRYKGKKQQESKVLPETAFDTNKPTSIKGKNLKPIEISKQRAKKMSKARVEKEVANFEALYNEATGIYKEILTKALLKMLAASENSQK